MLKKSPDNQQWVVCMAVYGVAQIYSFRPLSRDGGTPTSDDSVDEPKQLDLFHTPSVPETPPEDETQSAQQVGMPDSVDALFDRFFAEQVSRHDRDGDNLLSKEEFFGDADEFARLDRDNDGFVAVADLKAAFLEDNSEVRQMIEGHAAKLYNRLINAPAADDDELSAMVKEFFVEFVQSHDTDEKGWLQFSEFPGSVEAFDRIARPDTAGVDSEDLINDFLSEHPDLTALRDSLAGLQQSTQPQRAPPAHIDTYL